MTDDHKGCKVLTLRGGGIVAEFHTPECQARTEKAEVRNPETPGKKDDATRKGGA